MKRIVTTLTLWSFITTNSFAGFATAKKIDQAGTLDASFRSFKEQVFIKGIPTEIAAQTLVDQLIDQKITVGELQEYVAKYSTQQEYQQFKKMLNSALSEVDSLSELGSEELAFILKNTLDKTSATGAHFMSCSAGLGIGIPLILVGVIIGIAALANSTASKEVVTKDYIQKKQKLASDYLNTIADLELEKETYKADIIYYQDEIDELQRRIKSGLYSQSEKEEMHQLIRDYTFYITDAQALIEEVNVDLTYFENQYQVDSGLMEKEEVASLSEVDSKKAKAGKQAITAGIIGGVGTFFAAVGAADCN